MMKNLNKTRLQNNEKMIKLQISLTLVTLYFNTTFLDPFNSPKLIVLMVTSGLMLGQLINKLNSFQIYKRTVEFNTLLIIIIFAISNIAAFLFTDPKLIGLIGETQRRNGLITYLSLLVIFLFAFINVTFDNIYGFIKTSILIGFCSGIYGLLQLTGNDFVQWNNLGAPVITTLGNQNFASALLSLTALISLFSLIINISLYYKIIAIINILLAFFGIFGSDSRQGIVSFLLGLIFFATIFLVIKFVRQKYFIIICSSFVVLLILIGMLQIGPLTKYLYKDSISVRGFYWRAGWEMFLSSPFTGVGVDRYGSYFKEFREVNYPLRYGFEITSSNAHNTLIQFFATGGVLVGLSYLVLLVYVFIRSVGSIKNVTLEQQKILMLLFSTWIAFQSQSMISIDNIGLAIWGWALSGLLLGLSRQDSFRGINQVSRISKRSIKKELQGQLLTILLLFPVILVSSYVYKAEKDSWLFRGIIATDNKVDKNYIRMMAENIIKNPMADTSYKLSAALGLVDNGDLNMAYQVVIKLNHEDPRDLEVLRWLALYSEETNNLIQAVVFRSKIAELDPWNADNYLKIGQIQKKLGNTQESKKMLDKITSFASTDPISIIAKESLG